MAGKPFKNKAKPRKSLEHPQKNNEQRLKNYLKNAWKYLLVFHYISLKGPQGARSPGKPRESQGQKDKQRKIEEQMEKKTPKVLKHSPSDIPGFPIGFPPWVSNWIPNEWPSLGTQLEHSNKQETATCTFVAGCASGP